MPSSADSQRNIMQGLVFTSVVTDIHICPGSPAGLGELNGAELKSALVRLSKRRTLDGSFALIDLSTFPVILAT
jgi:hypothetical protein